MKALWRRYADRIDAVSLRERVMIFAAAAVVMVALLNALLIEPELNLQRKLSREIAKNDSDIRVLQEQLQAIARARQADPDSANRARLDELRRRIAAAETQLKEEQRRFAPPERVGAVLEELLSRNRRLQLVDMRTLPVTAFASPESGAVASPKPPADAKPAAGAGAPTGPIYRHGVEITISGGYLDLLNYMRDLEKLPSQMYWGRMELAVESHPRAILKLSVYTLSLDLAWLVV